VYVPELGTVHGEGPNWACTGLDDHTARTRPGTKRLRNEKGEACSIIGR
jgi:hypothetical protein